MNILTIRPATEVKIKTVALVIDGGLLLPQVTTALGSDRYAAGQLAFDYLAELAKKPATEISDYLPRLGLPSISRRDLNDSTDAALAVASAALLDCSRNRRLTVGERIEEAMTLLDEELAADW